jgi:aminoglycoside 6-adenylyltransferase
LKHLPPENDTLSLLVRWAESQPLVRAMLLTSTRAIPNTQSDIFSDYDVILALNDVRPFFEDRSWLGAFGKVLVMYQDPLETGGGHLHSGNVVQFESGLKIDFTLVETQYVASLSDSPQLPPEYDAGYRILLDKDGLTSGLKPPTYRAYIPVPPTEAQYLEAIEVSLLDATYVAKYLRRGDLMAARFIMTTFLQDEQMRPLLEWHYEIDHGWSVKPGLHGRRLKQWLRADLWAGLESTYVGPGLEENWEALFRTLELLRKVALEVGERLGFTYPEDMVRRALVYLQQVKDLDLGAA